MKKFLSLFLAVVLVLSMATVSTFAQKTPKLYIIGDGIVAAASQDMYPAQGWGEYFKNTVNGIEAVNAARHDSDMTSYIADGHWEAISKDLTENDFDIFNKLGIKVEKKYKLEENANYEFTFKGGIDELKTDYSMEEIFYQFRIINK